MLRALIFFVAVFLPVLGFATESEAHKTLADRLQHLQSFSGKFSQRQYDDADQLLQLQSGSFAIVAPGKIRWETTDPMAQLLISDGQNYWLYDPDLEQVTVSQVTKNAQQTPAVLFSGDAESLKQRYRVEQTAVDQYSLHSLAESEIFNQIDLSFAEIGIASMVMWDRLGQRTEFSFEDVLTNEKIDEAIFSFVPPEHVDIIYQ